MDLGLFSEILIVHQPALTGSLPSNLPHSTDIDPDPAALSDEATNCSSNPNRAGAVICKIENIFESLADCMLEGKKEMAIQLKSRKRRNHGHDAVSGMVKDLGEGKPTSVKFPSKNPQEAWKFAALLRILELSHEALATETVVTKRDVYYRDPELFMKQAVVDRYVDDIAYTLGVDRDALNVVAAAKGLIAGAFSVTRKDGSTVDHGSELEGILIPSIKEVESVELNNAKWILLIEKEATFRTLSTSQYYKNSLAGNGIILTAKGYPDISTRQILRLLSLLPQELPIFSLVDFDPDGIGIMSTYKYGSVALAHQNANLAVPRIQWLGIKSSAFLQGNDVDGNGRDKVGMLKLTKRDRRIAVSMLGKECFEEEGREREWRRELQVMLILNVKAEIQILSSGRGGLEAWLDGKLVDALG